MSEVLAPLLNAMVAEIIPCPRLPYRWMCIAYWPRDNRWKAGRLGTLEEAQKEATEFKARGWVHMTIYEFPDPQAARKEGGK